MANKRMFSKIITNSEEFFEMPISSQLLYFHLNMNADDDGFVQPDKVMRMSRVGTKDDLRLLHVKGFILPVADRVIIIKHWHINNTIRNDRYTKTIYAEHLKNLGINEETKVYESGIPVVNQMDTQIRLDLVKDSIDIISGKDIKSDKSDTKNTYGEYKNIKLTEIEYKKLKEKYNNTDYLINFLSAYKVEKAYKTRSDYLTILRWVADAVNKKKQQSAPVKQEKKYDYKENKLDFTGAFKNAE